MWPSDVCVAVRLYGNLTGMCEYVLPCANGGAVHGTILSDTGAMNVANGPVLVSRHIFAPLKISREF